MSKENRNIVCPVCNHKYTESEIQKSNNDLYQACLDEECVQEFCSVCGGEFGIKASYTPKFQIYSCVEDAEDDIDEINIGCNEKTV